MTGKRSFYPEHILQAVPFQIMELPVFEISCGKCAKVQISRLFGVIILPVRFVGQERCFTGEVTEKDIVCCKVKVNDAAQAAVIIHEQVIQRKIPLYRFCGEIWPQYLQKRPFFLV